MALAVLGAIAVAACSGSGTSNTESPYPDDDARRQGGTNYSKPASLFGEGGLLGGSGGGQGQQGAPGIGVNSYLWRASLDTISFMPVSSADPFGGVIITDWYSPPESADERFKVNLYILGRQLRADGLRASVFRQVQNGRGEWVDVEVDGTTATKLENAILARAREMRIASAE